MDASQNSLNKIEATLTPVFVLGVLALVVGVIDAAVLIYFALPAVNLASALVELVNQGGAAGIGALGSQADEIIKLMNSLKKKEEEPAPAPAKEPRLCPYCRMEIPEDATRCGHCTSVLDK